MGNFKKYGNIMVDLETLSTRTNASIIEICAVEFNKENGETGNTFCIMISPDEWGKNNRHVDGNTITWWFTREKDARERFSSDGFECVPLKMALEQFSLFVKDCADDDGKVVMWGNGSTMDITILQSAFEHFDMCVPWKYWCVNDVRTIVDLNPQVKNNTKFNGIKHSAVDDCLHQIKYLTDTLKTLIVKKKPSMPRYLKILIPNEKFEFDSTDFPYQKFQSKDYLDKTCLIFDLYEKKLFDWEDKVGKSFNFFMKIVDMGIYVLMDDDFNEVSVINGYVPNKVVPPTDGFGDYIDFTIDNNGKVSWYDYDKIDFSEFTI